MPLLLHLFQALLWPRLMLQAVPRHLVLQGRPPMLRGWPVVQLLL